MSQSGRCVVIDCPGPLQAAISEIIDGDVLAELPADIAGGDIVVLSASATSVAEGNAFSACRALKRKDIRIRVLIAVDAGDRPTEEIARFCLADGCIGLDASGGPADAQALAAALDPARPAPRLDALLTKLEARIADGQLSESGLEKMLEDHEDAHFLERLTDSETGLFDGPFASFKIDEEFKRAMRFHQPLSLVLLDCGEGLPESDADRRMVLAEIASVFLNECRDIDTLARFTETVFLFLLPGTGSDGASRVVRRMLDELSGREFSGAYKASPAAGIATAPMAGVTDRGAFLARAEACLSLAQTEPEHGGLCGL